VHVRIGLGDLVERVLPRDELVELEPTLRATLRRPMTERALHRKSDSPRRDARALGRHLCSDGRASGMPQRLAASLIRVPDDISVTDSAVTPPL